MQKKTLLIMLIMLLALAACGGGETVEEAPASEPAAVEQTDTTSEEMPAEEPAAEQPAAEEPAAEEPAAEEPAAEEPAAEEPAAEEPAAGGLQFEGVDPETGLVINPTEVAPGETFIVRGKIISMNLTPQTSPEFLIQAPNGTRYRMDSQGLQDIYIEDGTQLKPHEFRQGMWAQATATLAADAGASDIYFTDDLVILLYEE
jgi:type IV secretory pathway VirB10-like protein